MAGGRNLVLSVSVLAGGWLLVVGWCGDRSRLVGCWSVVSGAGRCAGCLVDGGGCILYPLVWLNFFLYMGCQGLTGLKSEKRIQPLPVMNFIAMPKQ
jgi:hypothetical protein